MHKTKARILDAALRLFNQHGYANVTIRNIASELNMSSGNLNYHYRKREEILRALYFEMVAVFDKRIEELGQKAITLKSIKNDMQQSLERMIDYRFFWTDLYNILRLDPAIKAHFEQTYTQRVQGYEKLFAYLRHQGLMKDFEFQQEEALLIDRMVGYSNTWLYNSLLYDQPIDQTHAKQQTVKLFAMLYAHLTEVGKVGFRGVMGEVF